MSAVTRLLERWSAQRSSVGIDTFDVCNQSNETGDKTEEKQNVEKNPNFNVNQFHNKLSESVSKEFLSQKKVST